MAPFAGTARAPTVLIGSDTKGRWTFRPPCRIKSRDLYSRRADRGTPIPLDALQCPLRHTAGDEGGVLKNQVLHVPLKPGAGRRRAAPGRPRSAVEGDWRGSILPPMGPT